MFRDAIRGHGFPDQFVRFGILANGSSAAIIGSTVSAAGLDFNGYNTLTNTGRHPIVEWVN